jgi:hypothetical protein
MFIRSIRRFRWGLVLIAIVAIAGLGLLNNCAFEAATPAERAEIMSALQKYQATQGAVITNPAQADVTVWANTAAAKYVITFPGGQIAAANQRARLVKKAEGWVVEDVEPKEWWK